MTDKKAKPEGLALMREPFPERHISKLPRPTKRQTEESRADFKKNIRCEVCGGWHHKDAIHLDYVGHAALTDRLLDCDPEWNWEPVAIAPDGAPLIDSVGGMWIKLTVCGVARLGYGHPDGKRGGDAIKETIGDALRNAAMRFGAALDLWHKGDLHGEDADESPEPPAKPKAEPAPKPDAKAAEQLERAIGRAIEGINECATEDALRELWGHLNAGDKRVISDKRVIEAKDAMRDKLASGESETPY